MSRNFIPAVLAIGVGVFTGMYHFVSGYCRAAKSGLVLMSVFPAGYYTFQPTFQHLATERAQGGQSPASTQFNNGANASAEGASAAAAKSAAIDSRLDGDKSK